MGFVVAATFYQLATFGQHPAYSTSVLIAAWGLLICALVVMRIKGSGLRAEGAPAPAAVAVS